MNNAVSLTNQLSAAKQKAYGWTFGDCSQIGREARKSSSEQMLPVGVKQAKQSVALQVFRTTSPTVPCYWLCCLRQMGIKVQNI